METQNDVTINELIQQYTDEYGDVFVKLLNNLNGDIDSAIDLIDNSYKGKYSSFKDYAIEIYENCDIDTSDEYSEYVDLKSFADDLIYDDDIFIIEINDSVHVFHKNLI